MSVTSFYPVVTATDVTAAAHFYREVFGFETTFESEWYVSLRTGAFELAVLAHDHPTVPERFRHAPRGVILNLEVDDVDAVHDRLTRELGVAPVQELRSEDFGQRHFIVEAPDGVLVDVITPIPPSEAFAGAFS